MRQILPGPGNHNNPLQQPPQQDPQPPQQPQAGAPAPKPKLDQKEMDTAANSIFKAMDGWWVSGGDRSKILDTLRGRSSDEIAAIKASYSEHFRGRDMDADLNKNLKGNDLAEAQATMSGDPVRAAVAAIKNAETGTFFGNVDHDKVHKVLEGISDEKVREKVRAEIGKEIGGLEKGNDQALTKALLEGDRAQAAAVKLDTSMNGGLLGNGGFLGSSWGLDKEGIYQTLGGIKDPTERQAVMKAYEKKTGGRLNADLGGTFKNAELDGARRLLAGDKSGAAAARAKAATEGLIFNDKDAIYGELDKKPKAERDAMIADYNRLYGAKHGGKDFDTMIDKTFSGLDKDKAKMLEKDGKLDDAFAMNYAMKGSFFSTDKGLIKERLQGKSSEEIDKIRHSYEDKYGNNLDTELHFAASGRDGFDIEQALQGEAKTVDQKLARSRARYQFERGKGSNAVSKFFVDELSDKGKLLDDQQDLIEGYELMRKKGIGDPKELEAKLGRLTGYQDLDAKNYQESKDTVTNGAATAASITAATLVTVASGGTAAPVAAAMLAGLVGSGTSMATKALIQSDGYSDEDRRNDGIMALANAGTAGLGSHLSKEGGMLMKLGDSFSQGKELEKQAFVQGVTGGFGGGVANTVSTVLRGGDLEKVVEEGGKGVGTGFVGGSATSMPGSRRRGAFQGALKPATQGTSPGAIVEQTLAGMGGSALGHAIDPDSYQGDAGQQALGWGLTLYGGGMGGMGSGLAERRKEQLKEQLKDRPIKLPTVEHDPDRPIKLPVVERAQGPEPGSPEQLAQAQQQQANSERAAMIATKQKHLNDIAVLREEARTPEQWAHIRELEALVDVPVSLRTSPHDDLEKYQAQGELPRKADGTRMTPDELHAAVAARDSAHEQELDARLAGLNRRTAGRDQAAMKDFHGELDASTASVTRDEGTKEQPKEVTRKVVEMEGKASVGMGGAGASGARVDPENRVGIEELDKRELWQGLKHLRAGQDPESLSYGVDGPRTSEFAQDGTGGFARARELAVQVASQRSDSGVGTLGTKGPVGALEFVPVTDPKTGEIVRYRVGVPMNLEDGTAAMARFDRVDLATGMGPSRQLSSKSAPGRPAQIGEADLAALSKDKRIISGEEALTRRKERFAGKKVLGIGGGPTSEWAMEHAAAGGAEHVEVAASAPKPDKGSLLKEPLEQLELDIRNRVDSGQPVPEDLTKQHHELMAKVVAEKQGTVARLEQERDTAPNPADREQKQQQIDALKGEIDPSRGSRVDRNHKTMNDQDIVHVQADVIKVAPAEGGQVEVTYADGTRRIVDQVIPSIGADGKAPGGIEHMLSKAPPDLKLMPVVVDGRVVGFESRPPGITISGASMTGTLGVNMPAEVLRRVPEGMRDAVIASFIDHASRSDVSAGSKGIIPGIENVGDAPARMQGALKTPTSERNDAILDLVQKYNRQRHEKFDDRDRFGKDK